MMGGSGMMGWGAGGLGGFWLGSIFMILFWVLLIAGVIWLVLAVARQTGTGTGGVQAPRSSALTILDERFARGEIDADEYQKRKSALGIAR